MAFLKVPYGFIGLRAHLVVAGCAGYGRDMLLHHVFKGCSQFTYAAVTAADHTKVHLLPVSQDTKPGFTTKSKLTLRRVLKGSFGKVMTSNSCIASL